MALNLPPLNTHPLGLLDFFQIKSGGEYPQSLPAVLQPGVDLLQWYAETNALQYNLTAAQIGATNQSVAINWTGSASPAGQPVTVPQTEIWYVTQYSARWQFSATAGGSLAGISLGVTGPLANAVQLFDTNQIGSLVSNAALVLAGSVAMQRPVFLRPGQALGYIMNGVVLGVGGTLDVSGGITYNRIRI